MRRVEMSEVCKVGGKTDKSGKKGRSAIYAHTILIVRSSRIEEIEYPDLQDSMKQSFWGTYSYSKLRLQAEGIHEPAECDLQ